MRLLTGKEAALALLKNLKEYDESWKDPRAGGPEAERDSDTGNRQKALLPRIAVVVFTKDFPVKSPNFPPNIVSRCIPGYRSDFVLDSGVKAYLSGIRQAYHFVFSCDDGIEIYPVPEAISAEEFRVFYRELNRKPEIDGVLPLAPYPSKEIAAVISEETNEEKDLDGVSEKCIPCTAEAVMDLLAYYKIPIEGKKAAVIGRSPRVGKPVSELFSLSGADVTVCHSKTDNIREICRKADILVVSCGKEKLVDASFVKTGATVIDCGIHEKDGRYFGDCDFESVSVVAESVAPVPNGVGALTSAVLIKHLVKAWANHRFMQEMPEM